jgi:hypothetical protein
LSCVQKGKQRNRFGFGVEVEEVKEEEEEDKIQNESPLVFRTRHSSFVAQGPDHADRGRIFANIRNINRSVCMSVNMISISGIVCEPLKKPGVDVVE